jgi:hypothetical protein
VLTWDSPRGDLDLLLTLAGEETCSVYGCFFGNCTVGDQRADFDDSGGVSGGDPVLVDDDFGLGPEVLRLPFAGIGDRLEIGVFSQPPSTNPTVQATVAVFSRGQSVGKLSQTMGPNTFWNTLTVDGTADGVTVVGSGTTCAVGQWICTTVAGACN